MSASVYASFLIDADNQHKPRAHYIGGDPDSGVIASVDVDVDDGGRGRACIQSADPEALRVLAAALIEAADQGDKLLAEAVS